MTDERIRELVERAVDEIESDLDDRRGLGQEWRQISPDLQIEIRGAWEAAIRTAVAEAVREEQEACVRVLQQRADLMGSHYRTTPDDVRRPEYAFRAVEAGWAVDAIRARSEGGRKP